MYRCTSIYIGTLLNRHPLNSGYPWYNGQFWQSQSFLHRLQYIRTPQRADTLLLCIMDTFCTPNCTQTIHINNGTHFINLKVTQTHYEIPSQRAHHWYVNNNGQFMFCKLAWQRAGVDRILQIPGDKGTQNLSELLSEAHKYFSWIYGFHNLRASGQFWSNGRWLILNGTAEQSCIKYNTQAR